MTKMTLPDLSTLKALYVEDEILIALDGQDILSSLGFGEVRMAHTLDDGLKLLEDQEIDFALLDINLGNDETTAPIAEQMTKRGTPFVFATGYNAGESLMEEFGAPFVLKPFDEESLKKVLSNLFPE